MTLTPMLIAPFQTGLDTDTEPWMCPPDAFTSLDNYHIKHGVLEKRSGYSTFARIVTLDTAVNFSGLPNGITNGDPGIVTTAVPHGYSTNDRVFITGVTGMTEVNDTKYIIIVLSPTTFSIGVDTTTFTPYTGAGTSQKIIPSTDRIMGISRFLDSTGVYDTLAFNTTRAAIYVGASEEFELLDAAAIMSGGNEDYIVATNWQSSNIVNRLYFTNGKAYDGASLDGIRYYDSAAAVTNSFTPNLGGGRNLYGCKFIFCIKQRLLVLNTYEFNGGLIHHPQRARWCQAQGPSNWDDITPGGGGYVDAPTGEQIVSARALQNSVIVQFTDSVWILNPKPDPNLPFQWTKINDFRACGGKMASIGYDRDVKALGVRGITATDGIETRRIDGRIEDFVSKEIDTEYFGKVFCERSYANRRWWTLYPSEQGSGENDKALIFDDDSNAFSIYSLNMNCLGHANLTKDYRLSDFIPANFKDFSLKEMGEDTIRDYYWQDDQEAFVGGDIGGIIYTLEDTANDDDSQITTEFTTAAWNPFKDQSISSQMAYVDFFVDTNQITTAKIDFFKDNNGTPYGSQLIDFLPNLNIRCSIIDATQTNPVNINAPDHGLSTGDQIYIYLIRGMEELNGLSYTITVVDSNNFTLDGINGTAYSAYLLGGVATERKFYRTKTWKRAYAGGNGYQHRIRLTSEGVNTPIRIHAIKPYFRPSGRETN